MSDRDKEALEAVFQLASDEITDNASTIRALIHYAAKRRIKLFADQSVRQANR